MKLKHVILVILIFLFLVCFVAIMVDYRDSMNWVEFDAQNIDWEMAVFVNGISKASKYPVMWNNCVVLTADINQGAWYFGHGDGASYAKIYRFPLKDDNRVIARIGPGDVYFFAVDSNLISIPLKEVARTTVRDTTYHDVTLL